AADGSEPIPAGTIERFTEAFAGCGFRPEAFYPCYGLAEATLFVTGGLSKARPRISIIRADVLEQGRAEDAAPDAAVTRALVSCGKPWLGQEVARGAALGHSLRQAPRVRVDWVPPDVLAGRPHPRHPRLGKRG